MSDLSAALWTEVLKARRSKVPWLAALGFSLVPLMGGLFMLILKDPEFALEAGLISAKAQLTAGVADWPTHLSILAAATAVGGILLYGLVASWVFGREYADHTLKDLLALPTSRLALVAAKFVVVAAWAAALSVWIFVLGLGVGFAVGLPGWSPEVALRGAVDLAVTAALTVALVTPVAFVAGAGRGYLPPMGFAMLVLFLAQVLGLIGWGAYFPWSVPALYAEMAGPRSEQLVPASTVIVVLTSVAGLAATCAWWRWADQTG